LDDLPSLRNEVRSLLVTNLMLQVTEQDIGDELPLFGQGGLGLDSVDALQLVVALDKSYGLKIADAAVARGILQNVSTIASAIARHRQGGP
jgi:acyl carrier protein